MATGGNNGDANPLVFMADAFFSAKKVSRKMLAVSLFAAKGKKMFPLTSVGQLLCRTPQF